MRRLGAPGVAHALLAALALLVAVAALAAEPVFPALTGRVVDDANILSADTRSRLDARLAEQERATGQQLVVVTLKSLQGYTIEDFGYQLGRHWGIGQKGHDNGALLIVAPKERKVRIEVGYGLEGTLTDAQSRVIIEQAILPQFRRGDFDAGVRDGVAAILRVLGGGQPIDRAQQARDVGGPFLLWLLMALVLIYFFWRTLGVPVLPMGGRPRLWYGGGFSGGGFSGGGFSGGGFSGGGGSFGGGGASGGW